MKARTSTVLLSILTHHETAAFTNSKMVSSIYVGDEVSVPYNLYLCMR